jgi:hypothetical protein
MASAAPLALLCTIAWTDKRYLGDARWRVLLSGSTILVSSILFPAGSRLRWLLLGAGIALAITVGILFIFRH